MHKRFRIVHDNQGSMDWMLPEGHFQPAEEWPRNNVQPPALNVPAGVPYVSCECNALFEHVVSDFSVAGGQPQRGNSAITEALY
jgi:hypothetical protein